MNLSGKLHIPTLLEILTQTIESQINLFLI